MANLLLKEIEELLAHVFAHGVLMLLKYLLVEGREFV
jgi:hypothetical protein